MTKCRYCGKELPQPGMDGIIYADVKGGSGLPSPVCDVCLRKPALKLKPVAYRKVSVVE